MPFFLFLAFVAFDLRAEPIPGDTLQVAYKLHGQTRRFKFVYEHTAGGGMTLHWSIMRNLKLWTGSYAMTETAVKDAKSQSWIMPEDGNHVILPSDETFAVISLSSLKELRKTGELTYNGVLWRKTGISDTPFGKAIEVEDPEEGARMTVLDSDKLPLILSMQDNPLEINWYFYN